MRLQKYLSAAGLCSRREAEKWIESGRVAINGRVAALGESVGEGESVTVDGKTVSLPEEHTYVLLHKPRGYVTTLSDERGRPTVAELVKDVGKRLFPVGRLDYDSEGLLLMTDDGETAHRLMHPSHEVEKVYHVLVQGDDIERAAAGLRTPLSDGETTFAPAGVEILSGRGNGDADRAVLSVTIHEGKNREVRRMCALVGLRVLRLRRVAQGELTLGELPAGQWRCLTEKELQFLRSIPEKAAHSRKK